MFEIKDFNVLIDGKPFFEIPVRNKEEAYDAIIETTKNNNYRTGNSWIMNIIKVTTN